MQSEIRGISEHKLEEWISDYLIDEIKSSGRHQIDKIAMSIDTSLDIMIHNNQNINQGFKQYLEEIVNITRRINTEWLEDITYEFIKHLKRKIENYYDVFYGIDNNRFYNALDQIESNLKGTIKRINNHFEEEYLQIYKTAIKKQTHEIKNNIQSNTNQQENINEENISRAVKILRYNDYDLIR